MAPATQLVGRQPDPLVEERKLVVVDVEDERPVPRLLRQHTERQGGQARLRHPDGVGVDPRHDVRHDRPEAGEVGARKRVDGDVSVAQGRPDPGAVPLELRPPDLDVEAAPQECGEDVRAPQRVVTHIPCEDRDRAARGFRSHGGVRVPPGRCCWQSAGSAKMRPTCATLVHVLVRNRPDPRSAT